MGNFKALVIEDEQSILELISFNLEKAGIEVFKAESGEEGLRLCEEQQADIVILDLMLPGMDGLEVCKRLKEKKALAPAIVMISARGEETDIIRGLEIGADDYLTKPFSPAILTARVEAVMRRTKDSQVPDDASVDIHGISIDPKRHRALAGDRELELTATEFALLKFLASHPGWVFTRYQIVDAVKGGDYAVTERSVDVQVVGLRKKLEEHGALIETVRGVGYRFKE
ncbi:UNVERIFIED_CONTAM: hypothetical protein GTU68_029427 [Idotea baltica]|nr:hypothetical protein [Idotea baltica]